MQEVGKLNIEFIYFCGIIWLSIYKGQKSVKRFLMLSIPILTFSISELADDKNVEIIIRLLCRVLSWPRGIINFCAVLERLHR
jgi:hypothetical protein